MQDLKFIYWFAFYNEDSPSVRYRGKFPLDYFKEKHGVDSELITPSYRPIKILRFARAYCSALFFCKKDTLIVIQRVHSNFIYSSLLKLLVRFRTKNSVYDLDDADYLYCKPNSIYYFAKRCGCISAGSRAIAEHLSKFNPNCVITPSPTLDLGITKRTRNSLFTIGWIGGFGGDHKKSMMELVFPALLKLNFPCRFVLLGVTKEEDHVLIQRYFEENKAIKLEIPRDINWRDEEFIQGKISEFDVGIATLIDNEVQRSKSGIKAKQYLNNGVPVLGTNLPENDWVIREGVNGFFCANSEGFYQRMNEFHAMSDEEYGLYSENAKASITAFNHDSYFERFTEIVAVL